MGLGSLLGKVASIGAAPFTGGASLTPMLIGAAAGAGKHFLVDKPAEKRSREQSAAMMRVSPWSKITPTAIKSAPGLFNSVLQGGAVGATVGGALGGAGAMGAGDLAANAGAGPLSNTAFAAKQAAGAAPAWAANDWMKMRPQGFGPLR